LRFPFVSRMSATRKEASLKYALLIYPEADSHEALGEDERLTERGLPCDRPCAGIAVQRAGSYDETREHSTPGRLCMRRRPIPLVV
jgi:hypothetical protein